ncbi:hypothetical protein [Nocardiopsis sp. MG754419]|uniref:TPR repeat region-containing protein n=1 Tax=Nocardiopsis sp. MG754419 TaxID=2259865 RepID=UPI001BA53DF7|nr:hypothetical protein [Nocardiopsis sp. MG754419]MBR8743567.1 hypothetical protein [Nocardiopsis sp. MG754419]
MPGERGGDAALPGLVAYKGYRPEFKALIEGSPSLLNTFAEDLTTMEARILGRSHDLEGAHDAAAMEFSDVIMWSIGTMATDDQVQWQQAAASVNFCAALTEELATTLQTYRDERSRLIERWNEEAPVVGEDIGSTSVIDFPNLPLWTSKSEKATANLQALIDELEGDERTAHTTATEGIEQISEDLRGGAPTPEAIERLKNGGYVNWSYFNLGGSLGDIPEDIEPEEMANEVLEYLNGDKEPDARFDELMTILSSVGWRAQEAREVDGSEMDPRDMQFLKDFYDKLEETVEVAHVARLAPDLLGEEDSAALLGALGTGIMVLSDQRLTHGDSSVPGGYYDLPPSVRRVVEGDPDFGMQDHDWKALGNLFGHVPEGIEGGRGLSLTLGLTIGNELNDPYALHSPENLESMEAALEVATRNNDANADMISGPGDWYEHPRLGADIHGDDERHEVLEAIFTQEWPDDGAAASGYTDWILEAREAAGEDTQQVDEVAKDLISFLTDEERYDRMTDLTGGMYSDHFGQDGLSFTQVNNEMANGLVNVFGAYVEEFSLNNEQDGVRFSDSTGRMLIGEDERLRFLEYVAGGPDAASTMVAISEMHAQGLVPEMLENGFSPGEAGENTSRLDKLINDALLNEAQSRMESNDAALEEAYERKVAGRELFIDLVFKPADLISTSNPVTDLVISEMLSGAKTAITDASTGAVELELGPVPGLNAQSDFSIAANEISMGGTIIDYYIQNDILDPDELDSYEHLGYGNDGFVVQNYDDDVRRTVQDEINDLLAKVDGGRGLELLDAYGDAYHTTRTDDQSETEVDTSDRPEGGE